MRQQTLDKAANAFPELRVLGQGNTVAQGLVDAGRVVGERCVNRRAENLLHIFDAQLRPFLDAVHENAKLLGAVARLLQDLDRSAHQVQ